MKYLSFTVSGKHLALRLAALSRRRRIACDTSGSSLLETALSLAALMLGIMGTLDCSRLVYLDHYVGNAARDGARYAMVRGSTWTATCSTPSTFSCAASSANVTSYVIKDSPSSMVTTSLKVTAAWPGTSASGAACDTTGGSNSPGCVVQVTVSYPYKSLVPFLPKTALTSVNLSSTSAITISQ